MTGCTGESGARPDPEPEVLLMNVGGISLYDHDGTSKYEDLRPNGDPPADINWLRPAAVHDFDGDGHAEYAVSARNNDAAYEADGSLLWTSARPGGLHSSPWQGGW